MAKKKADSKIVQLIYRLAGDSSQVRTTERAYYDMLAYEITVEGVCEAIREWIETGNDIIEDITQISQSHIGKPIYIMKPKINKQNIYLKVGIGMNPKTREYMLVISAHQLN
jgi:hypothetical protein